MKKIIAIVACATFISGVLSWVFYPKQLEKPLPSEYDTIIHFQGDAKALSSAEQVSLMREGEWGPKCPIAPYQLALVTFSYWGFDDRPHINEGHLIVPKDLAVEVLGIFKTIYQHHFPIDMDNTTGFNCRWIEGQSGILSEHSYGLAIDVNAVQNPMSTWPGDRYLNRDRHSKGMILDHSAVVAAFKKLGWVWGGDWNVPKDYMHFQKTRQSQQIYMKFSHQWPDLTRFIYNPEKTRHSCKE